MPAARSLLAGSPSPEHAAASVLDHQAVPLLPLPVPFSLKPPLLFPHDLSLFSTQRRLGGFLKEHGHHLARSAGWRREWSRLAGSAPCLVPGPAVVLIRHRAPSFPRSSAAPSASSCRSTSPPWNRSSAVCPFFAGVPCCAFPAAAAPRRRLAASRACRPCRKPSHVFPPQSAASTSSDARKPRARYCQPARAGRPPLQPRAEVQLTSASPTGLLLVRPSQIWPLGEQPSSGAHQFGPVQQFRPVMFFSCSSDFSYLSRECSFTEKPSCSCI